MKCYPNGVRALDEFSFAVQEGEVFGLLGPNGAGKSTAVRVLVTLTRPTSGTAHVAGCDILRDARLVRRAIGYVPQASNADAEATARENLHLRGRIHRVPKARLKPRVEELLRLFDLSHAADRLVRTYSGGMRRRLDVALALLHTPRIIFLDEPTTGLDPESRSVMWSELRRLTKHERLTILLTTHYLEEADQLADRVGIVSRGRIGVVGTPDELKQRLARESIIVEIDRPLEASQRTALAQLTPVQEVGGAGRLVRAEVDRGQTALPQVVAALLGSGVGVKSVSIERPSLDDVYLHYASGSMGECA